MRHPFDLVGGAIVAHGPDRLRFFSDGWGDRTVIETVVVPNSEPDPIPIEWVSASKEGEIHVSVGVFESPAAVMPEHARHGAVTRIVPRSGSDAPAGSRC